MKIKQARLAFTLGEGKTDFLAVALVLLVDVFDKSLEVFNGFFRLFGFGYHINILRCYTTGEIIAHSMHER
jgi:hypothetical protein